MGQGGWWGGKLEVAALFALWASTKLLCLGGYSAFNLLAEKKTFMPWRMRPSVARLPLPTTMTSTHLAQNTTPSRFDLYGRRQKCEAFSGGFARPSALQQTSGVASQDRSPPLVEKMQYTRQRIARQQTRRIRRTCLSATPGRGWVRLGKGATHHCYGTTARDEPPVLPVLEEHFLSFKLSNLQGWPVHVSL